MMAVNSIAGRRLVLVLMLVCAALFGVFGFAGAQDDFEFDDEFEFIDLPEYGFGEDDFEIIDEPEAEEAEEPEEAAEPIDPSVLPEPEVLLSVADELYFPRVGYSETFWETQGYVNEILDGGIIHQYYVRSGMGTDLLMSMLPAEKGARTTNLRLNMKRDWEKEYHVSVTLLRAEDMPNGSGGCWLRYSNVRTKGRGSESGLILFPGREAYGFVPEGNLEDLDYTFVSDLSDLNQNNSIRFDFIRLDGVSYVYANGRFLFSYDDGFDGKMSFEGGAELYEGGNRVRCDFDNFTMRYR